jgi:hypothetical protein
MKYVDEVDYLDEPEELNLARIYDREMRRPTRECYHRSIDPEAREPRFWWNDNVDGWNKERERIAQLERDWQDELKRRNNANS